ncbi:hypothetical protein Leryth_016790 [Lithospermum erythrorhizon]|nr:hypothetical protein Leryth_016790 [Lithospermum erythrorhizon]
MMQMTQLKLKNIEGNCQDDSRAIVQFNGSGDIGPNVVSMNRKKHIQRSGELVRVPDVGDEDETYFREVVKITRMRYTVLRLALLEDKKIRELLGLHVGGLEIGLKAAEMMNDEMLWLNRDKRIIGTIPEFEPGAHCYERYCLWWVRERTGQGGQDKLRTQCADQKLESGNLALERSMHYGVEGKPLIVECGREQSEIFTMNGNDDSLVYPGRFSDRWGDLSLIFPHYVRPSYPSILPLDYALDIWMYQKMRNVACYISHRSAPNAFVQPVLYDHNDTSFPHLMLFALENIPPLSEISIDYGI